MNSKITPLISHLAPAICAGVMALAAGCTSPSSVTRRALGPENTGPIQQAYIQVDSSFFGARILCDGMFVGTAPTTVAVDVNAEGLLLADVTIGAEIHNSNETAEFGDPSPNEIMQDLPSGTPAPVSIRFTPTGASVRNR